MLKPSLKTQHLKQSGIRAASVQCAAVGGINLGQGVCDIPTPDVIKQAAYQAIEKNKNLYSPCEGILPLRTAVAQKMANFNKIHANPETEVVITHGSTGAFVCAVMTLFNPGDEIILFEPFYGYHKNILELNNLVIKTVSINLDTLRFQADDIIKVISKKTKGIVICTPCNPCGKVFSRDELLTIGEIAERYNLAVITDEIYEYITYPGYEHVSFASLQDFKQRTVTISGFSKTYNMTGWRLGYAVAPAVIAEKMSLVQDLLYVCPVTPLQHSALAAFNLPDSYYSKMNEQYLHKRDIVVTALCELGFKVTVPQGAYYILANFKDLGIENDEQATQLLLTRAKVATVTGRSFYLNPVHGKEIIRICYALNEDKITLAMEQLQAIHTSTV